MKIGLGIVAGSMLLVIMEAFASYYWSQNFWPSQVVARWGKTGISFFAHGGMWGDFFLLPPLFAFIITKYGGGWSVKQVVILGIVGFAITSANHLLLIFTQTIPDPLGWQKEKWSTLITLHFVYMSTYVALVGLFFICSNNVSVAAAVMVAVILGIHMALGTHVPLGILQRWMRWMWCPDLLHPGLIWMQLGLWLILSSLAWYAAGWRAGLSVATIAVALAVMVMITVWKSPPALNT